MNAAWMIYDKNKWFKFKCFSEECFKLYSYENRQTGKKGGLNNKKRQYVS